MGIVISSNFKFIEHINHILLKVNSAKAQLRYAFSHKYMNKNVKTLLFKQIVRPLMLYACACWLQISSHQMERMRKIERWFLRKITGLNRSNTTNRYINSKHLYIKSGINRLDQELVKHNVKTIQKMKQNENEHINNIVNWWTLHKHEQIQTYKLLSPPKWKKTTLHRTTNFWFLTKY